jgi:hypothetical protein
LTFDVLLDTPIIYFRSDATGYSLHFSDGPKWDNSGRFSLVTPMGTGGERDDKKLFYIRGRFVDSKQIEFYLISPEDGLQGPFKAIHQ